MPFEDPKMETTGASAGNAAQNNNDQASNNQNAGQFAVYDGTAGPIAKIAMINAILGVFTLGIYRFWGKTRMRQYLWSRVTILGDRLEYTGTPKELLLGFLVAAAIMALLSLGFLGISFLAASPVAQVALNLIYLIGIYFLIYFATYRARRYRLTRTQWRGIRFGQTGSARGYAVRAMALAFLTGITFGLCYPYMQTRLQDYRTNNTWFGSRNLVFDGQAYDLFWRWVLAMILAIPTLYISILWYKVVEFRYFASRTRFGTLSFSSSLTTMNVFLVVLLYGVSLSILYAVFFGVFSGAFVGMTGLESMDPNAIDPALMDLSPGVIATLVVLGLVFVSLINAVYFVLFLHPMAKAVSASLLAKGSIDLDAIKQSDQERGGRGEGFADVMDVGAI